jgi:exonuclease III
MFQSLLIGWEPVSARIITAKFKTSHKRITLNITQWYAPTNDADEELKEEFYQMLEETTRRCSEKDITILLGDMNATVGNENTGYEQAISAPLLTRTSCRLLLNFLDIQKWSIWFSVVKSGDTHVER